ncbi:Zinc finger CCHC domain-containing protein 4 [Orchesella cincta]|uniref:Zinc finger CCHC domain-containing protein 4 n=1 Tax=Orchesella cincta TaxID=48709 RepID=A0A1D2M9Q0_ORCCI|nr:Zinc finger CCHC domain-containing protein 4 [Orchesella cincta]
MGDSEITKTVPIIRDLALNPSCPHGPTILFERAGQRFFSCSAFRSRKLCQFYMTDEHWSRSKARETKDGDEPHRKATKRSADEPSEVSGSQKIKRVEKINHPLSFPNQRDKGEAQYHFNDQTVQFFMDQFSKLKFDSVLCVGTPSLHQHITDSSQGLKSFLLDIDDRFESSSSEYQKFISKAGKLAIVVDPPFGVKVELIWHGCLSGILSDYGKVNDSKVEIFWIFPYFMEGHILSRCPSSGLKMSDFHVEYRNHAKYSGGSRSKSSPIRVFTTVPLSKLVLSEEDYRYCDNCSKWVDKLNLHCDSCETCTTKDGGKSYVHCYKCEKCVKPSWKHCSRCQICHLADSPEKCVAKGAESKTGYPKSSKKQRHSLKKS